MFTLKELLNKKEELKEISDLPIEDFVGWGGWERMIDSHIKTLKKVERYERALLSIHNIEAMFLVGDTEGKYCYKKAHDEMLNTATKALYETIKK